MPVAGNLSQINLNLPEENLCIFFVFCINRLINIFKSLFCESMNKILYRLKHEWSLFKRRHSR